MKIYIISIFISIFILSSAYFIYSIGYKNGQYDLIDKEYKQIIREYLKTHKL